MNHDVEGDGKAQAALMRPLVVGLNIKSAPLELLERLSVHHSSTGDVVQELKALVPASAIVVLSTCNRLEIYATCVDPDLTSEAIESWLGDGCGCDEGCIQSLNQLIYGFSDDQAIRHLFEVATGLDSLIVGEAEILGQVSRAYSAACTVNATDKLMNVWFQRALHLGKKTRAQTALGRYSLSIGRIAVKLAVAHFGDVADKRALILGAGEMSELTAKYLVDHHFPVVMIANRSLAHAKTLAEEYGFEAYPLTTVEDCLLKADVVFSATSAKNVIVTRPMVERAMEARGGAPLLFIDMAIPRDVDPDVALVPGVALHNINELRDVADRHQAQRAMAVGAVRELVEEEVADFRHWMHSLELVPTITALRSYADSIKEERLAAALDKLPDLSPAEQHTVHILATTIADSFVRAPIESLKTHAGSPMTRDYARMLHELFDLPAEEMPSCVPAASSQS